MGRKSKKEEVLEEEVYLIELVDEEKLIWLGDDGKYYLEDGTEVEKPKKKRGRKRKILTPEEEAYLEEKNKRKQEEEKIIVDEKFRKYLSLEGRKIILNLNNIFNRNDINFSGIFTINKRSYYKITGLIIKDFQLIIENCPDFILFLLEIKEIILRGKEEIKEQILEEYNKKDKKCNNLYKEINKRFDNSEVYDKIQEIVNEEELFEFVDNYVEETYTLNLNERIKEGDKNSENAITDEKNKIVLKTSIISRLLVPLICEGELLDDQTYRIFKLIMNKFDTDKQTTRKIFRFIELRVNRTIYPDKIIWKFLSERAYDPTLYIRELIRAITIGIITKLGYNRNIVSYFDVVINEKIRFLFTYSYKIKYKSIKNSDKELEDTEKLRIHMLMNDSSIPIMNDLSIFDIIDRIDERCIEEEDFNYLSSFTRLERNTYTTKLMEIFYDGKFNVLLADEEQRVWLILYLKSRMIKAGFKVFPEIITSKLIPEEKHISNRRKLNEKITTSDEYIKFLHEYKDVLNIIEKNNPLLQLMSIKNFTFINSNGNKLDIDIDDLSADIFKMIKFHC